MPHTRRELITNVIATSAVAASATEATAGTPNPISRENRKPGHSAWQLTRCRLTGMRSPWIEGYCSQQSALAGETVQLFVSTNPACSFKVDVFRMGYYGGAGARLMTTLGPFPGKVQPDPVVGPARLRECRWTPSLSLTIPKDWVSGVYLARLTLIPGSTDQGAWQSWIVFIVKDRRPADILFQCSDNTWQAYNQWPDKHSLYTDPRGSLVSGVEVSFDRPYARYAQIFEPAHAVGSGEFLLWEYPLCYWLEKHGYDVTYCSNSDMVDPATASRCKSFVSVGHDEYWDLKQYSSVRSAIDGGTSCLFLSGNSICFVAPFQASHDGRPNRIISRAGRYGGLSVEEKKMMGPFPVEGPNEALLMGARTITPFNGGGDWIVSKPDHWIFEGTGMKRGDLIPGLVGWEFHGDPAEIPELEVVAEGIALSSGITPAHWTATVYPGPKGNVVFNASTIWWAQGLSSPPGHMLPWSHFVRPHGPDPRVERITHNVLNRALSRKSV